MTPLALSFAAWVCSFLLLLAAASMADTVEPPAGLLIAIPCAVGALASNVLFFRYANAAFAEAAADAAADAAAGGAAPSRWAYIPGIF